MIWLHDIGHVVFGERWHDPAFVAVVMLVVGVIVGIVVLWTVWPVLMRRDDDAG